MTTYLTVERTMSDITLQIARRQPHAARSGIWRTVGYPAAH